jgi:hypothetical protein
MAGIRGMRRGAGLVAGALAALSAGAGPALAGAQTRGVAVAAPGGPAAAERPRAALPMMGPRTLPQGELLAVGTSPEEGIAFFVDLTRLKRLDGRVQVFVYTVMDPPQQAGNAPMAQLVEADIFDCRARTLIREGMTGYDDMDTPVALGHREPETTPEGGSVQAMVLKTVCDDWRPDVHLQLTGHRAAYEAALAELARVRKDAGGK